MPKNKYKQYFDLLIVILLIYTATLVPYFTVFFDDVAEGQFAFDLCVDVFFAIDIVLTFFTAYNETSDTVVVSRSKIALRYLKGTFLLDVLTTIPFQLIQKISMDSENVQLTGETQNAKILRIIRLQRLYRLFRLFRLIKLMRLFKLS